MLRRPANDKKVGRSTKNGIGASDTRGRGHARGTSRVILEFRFAIVASVALVCVMAFLCTWISRHMVEGVLHRSASETVLNIDSVIKPLVQSLAREPTLPREAQDALSAVLVEKSLGHAVAAIKIWSTSGTVVYSNRPELVGRSYPVFSNLQLALNGEVVAQFDDLNDDASDDENDYERHSVRHCWRFRASARERYQSHHRGRRVLRGTRSPWRRGTRHKAPDLGHLSDS